MKHLRRISKTMLNYLGALQLIVFLATNAQAADSKAAVDAALSLQTIEDFREVELADARKPITEVETSYRAELEKTQKDSQSAGNLDGVIAAKSALDDLNSNRPPVTSSNAGIAKIQKAYLTHRSTAETATAQATLKIDQNYVESLNKLVQELTKAGQIDDALKIRAIAENTSKGLKEAKLGHTGNAVTIEAAKKRANEEFPGLTDPKSELSLKVKKRIEQLKLSDPAFFSDPQWPYLVAREASLDIASHKAVSSEESQDTQILGKWNCVNDATSQGNAVFEFESEGKAKITPVSGKALKAKWRIEGDTLVVVHEDGASDHFNLPAKDDKLTGTSPLKSKITLTRKSR